MEKITGNEPAFPIPGGSANQNGITKREYFAAMAMQGLLSNPEWMTEYKKEKYLMQSDIVASVSFQQADAFIKELNKSPQTQNNQ
jgi:hypothetical protein